MSRAAIRYAKAVLSSASDKGAVEAVYHDMRAVVATRRGPVLIAGHHLPVWTVLYDRIAHHICYDLLLKIRNFGRIGIASSEQWLMSSVICHLGSLKSEWETSGRKSTIQLRQPVPERQRSGKAQPI